jgi:hypothetical protein
VGAGASSGFGSSFSHHLRAEQSISPHHHPSQNAKWIVIARDKGWNTKEVREKSKNGRKEEHTVAHNMINSNKRREEEEE